MYGTKDGSFRGRYCPPPAKIQRLTLVTCLIDLIIIKRAMPKKTIQRITQELKFTAGSLLEFIVLKMLSSKTYSVDELFAELKSSGFQTPKGSIYPLMSRLRTSGLVRSGAEESDTGSFLRTYDLTEKGRQHLASLRSDWKRLNALIAGLGC